jgi:hypothetical protein
MLPTGPAAPMVPTRANASNNTTTAMMTGALCLGPLGPLGPDEAIFLLFLLFFFFFSFFIFSFFFF